MMLLVVGLSACNSPANPKLSPASAPDYTVSLEPSSLSITQGSNAPITITLTREEGFNDALNVSLKDPPAGLSAEPLTISEGASNAALTLNALSTLPQTTMPSTLTLNLEGGSLPAKTATLNLQSVRGPSGSLDTTFAGGVAQFGQGNSDFANDVALQPDGKLVLVGASTTNLDKNSDTRFALARLNPDGSLDSTFGAGGKVSTQFAGGINSIAYAVAVQPDGKIVVAGETNLGGKASFALARYTPKGLLDAGFNPSGPQPGTLSVDFGGSSRAKALALQPDGKIIVAGTFYGASPQRFALARLDTDGMPDSSFGTDGKVTTLLTTLDGVGIDSAANRVLLQPDGKILLAGFSISPTTEFDFALARYTPEGALDSNFAANGTPVGTLTTDFAESTDLANALALQPDGKIILAGEAVPGDADTSQFGLARYLSDGTPDEGFGPELTGQILVGSVADSASGVSVQSDGRILVAGTGFPGVYSPANAQVHLARLTPSGGLDSSFGTGGQSYISIGQGMNINAMVVQPDGRLVVVGQIGTPVQMLAARFWP